MPSRRGHKVSAMTKGMIRQFLSSCPQNDKFFTTKLQEKMHDSRGRGRCGKKGEMISAKTNDFLRDRGRRNQFQTFSRTVS